MDVPILDWFGDVIKDSINSVFNGANETVEAMDIFNTLKNYHLASLASQVGTVKILGMQQPVSLEKLYYPTKVSTDIRRRIYTSEWGNPDTNGAAVLETNQCKTKPKKTLPEEDGDNYIKSHDRVVVLGGPGAGKTTFLKFLALAYSRPNIFKKTRLSTPYFPIFIHLPSFSKEKVNLIEFISAGLTEKGHDHAIFFYKKIFETGKAALFLDSLDEVPKEHRTMVIEEINNISNQYQKCKIIVSCRTADYEQILNNFSEVELARLTKDAVASIIRAWFDHEKEKGERLIQLLENDATVASLTETPLLLSLLCIQFKNDLALPKIRTELYRRCVDALLRDWDTTRGFRRDTAYSQLSDDRKERIFENVAGNACSQNIEYEMPEYKVLDNIAKSIERLGLDANDAKGILKEIESHHGILEKSSINAFEFSHGTMHEYFAARYFIAKRIEIDILKKHYEDESWHNVILFMVSIIDDPTNMLMFLQSKSSMEKKQNYPAIARRIRHLWLLYRCITVGVSISSRTRTDICNHLVSSQIQMLKIINNDGVLPYAVKTKNGVRNFLFSYNKYRQTIDEILRPYRSLMNEISLCPIKEYTDNAIEKIKVISSIEDEETFAKIGIITCLLVPISDSKPDEFIERMQSYSEAMMNRKAYAIKNVIAESIQEHTRNHIKNTNFGF